MVNLNPEQQSADRMEMLALKEKGNEYFKEGKYSDALTMYTKALKLCPDKSEDKATVHKNRAAVYLKLEEYEDAAKDADAALEIVPSDVKALFRRCQAYEHLKKYDEAFKDALKINHIEPNNSAIQPVLRRLNTILQDLAKEHASTTNKVKQMLSLLSGQDIEMEKRVQAANNLVVLARERAGAELLVKENGVKLFLQVMKKEKNPDIMIAGIRVCSELCKNSIPRTIMILEQVGLPLIIDSFCSKNEQHVTAVQYLVQTIINTLTGMDIKEGKKPDKELVKEHENRINVIINTLVRSSCMRTMTAIGRDAILELIMRNVDHETLEWGIPVIDAGGLDPLLQVASELQEIRYESSMEITDSTRAHISVVLERIYLCCYFDQAKQKYRDEVMKFMNEKLKGPDVEAKVRATAAITALLQGPLDVGNHCLAQEGIVEMMLVMAGSDDEAQQKVAAEAIIAAASKKDKCTSIVSMGTGILKKLYQSSNDNIKVRALVGLCKVGSVGGTDASIRPFADGSTKMLSNACRKFLVNPSKDRDLRKWAAEGLAYLTLDADVKEELIADRSAVFALIELARTGGLTVLFGVVTTLVNLTNSYDKQEIIPELVELAKFAKQHVPEEHPKDAKEYSDKRCRALVEMGVTTALVALSKTESKNSRELISRVFNAICEHADCRGTIVQQGGAKALLSLALEGTTRGMQYAAQALARLGITIDPTVAFPGQRSCEVVRPVMSLLHPDCSGLQNFEGLMCLTNLATVSPSVRSRILQDNGLTKIESFMYEDHEMLKRAATQCIVNLMFSEDVVKIYEGPNDRVKYLVILCIDDDLDTAMAASSALAILTSVSSKACEKILEAKDWLGILCKITASSHHEIQHRAVCIVHNMIFASKDLAQKVIETQLLEILMAIARPETDDIPDKIKNYAKDALKKSEEWELIKKTEDLAV